MSISTSGLPVARRALNNSGSKKPAQTMPSGACMRTWSGRPLRWNLFAAGAAQASAQPLLQKGQVLSDTTQLAPLLEAGLYAEEEAPPSVLHQLNQCNRRLERLLTDLRNEHNAEAELRD